MSDLPGVLSGQEVSLAVLAGFLGELVDRPQGFRDLILFFA